MYINLTPTKGARCSKEAEAGLPGRGQGQDHPQGHHEHQSLLIRKVLDAAKKLRLAYLEEDKERIILKSIMNINLNSF